jgi:hypothetical protein
MKWLYLSLLLIGSLLLRGVPVATAAAPDGSTGFVAPPTNIDQCYGDVQKGLNYTLLGQGREHVLLAWGAIGADETARFDAALRGAAPVHEVRLCSNGGNLEAGINIGYLIHQKKLATVVPTGFVCISACNFAFMGGLIRTVEPGGVFKVHMFTGFPLETLKRDVAKQDWTIEDYALGHPRHMNALEEGVDQYIESHQDAIKADYAQYLKAHPEAKLSLSDFVSSDAERKTILNGALHALAIEEDVNDIQQSSAQNAAEIAEFLVTMRLSLHFLTAFANIPNDTPRALTRAELIEYNISNTE